MFQDEDSDAQYRSASQGSSELEFLSDSPDPLQEDQDTQNLEHLRPPAPSPHTPDPEVLELLRASSSSPHPVISQEQKPTKPTPEDQEISEQVESVASSKPTLLEEPRPDSTSHHSSDSESLGDLVPIAPRQQPGESESENLSDKPTGKETSAENLERNVKDEESSQEGIKRQKPEGEMALASADAASTAYVDDGKGVDDAIVPVQHEHKAKQVEEDILQKLSLLEQDSQPGLKPSVENLGTQYTSAKLQSVVEDVVEPIHSPVSRTATFPTSTPKDTPPLVLSPPIPPSVSTVDPDNSIIESIIDDSLDDIPSYLNDQLTEKTGDTLNGQNQESSTLQDTVPGFDDYVVIDDIMEPDTHSSGSNNTRASEHSTTDNSYQYGKLQPRVEDIDLVAVTRVSETNSFHNLFYLQCSLKPETLSSVSIVRSFPYSRHFCFLH